MKKLLSIIIVLVLTMTLACEENDKIVAIESLNCPSTEDKYVNFKIEDELVCWSESNSVRVDNLGAGNCGMGYEDNLNPYLSTGIRGFIFNPSLLKIERSLIIYFTHSCSAYESQEKFYNLIKPGNYSVGKSGKDFGKFYISYYENGTGYSSNGDQNDARVEVVNVKRIYPEFTIINPGGLKNGMPAALELTLIASFNLYEGNGEFFKRVSGSSFKGLLYRQSPWGIEWDDYYGN